MKNEIIEFPPETYATVSFDDDEATSIKFSRSYAARTRYDENGVWLLTTAGFGIGKGKISKTFIIGF